MPYSFSFSYLDIGHHTSFLEVEQALLERGHKVTATLGGDPNWSSLSITLQKPDKQKVELKPFNEVAPVDIVVSRGPKNAILVKGKAYVRLLGIDDYIDQYDAKSNQGYTLILVPGRECQRHLRQVCSDTEIKVSGIPHLDRIFSLPETTFYELVYAPNWGSTSSLANLGSHIAKLASKFPGKCLFRPHVNTRRLNKYWLEEFRAGGWDISTGDVPLGLSSRRSGISLVDASSGEIWESALLNEFTFAIEHPGAFTSIIGQDVRKYIPLLRTEADIDNLFKKLSISKPIPRRYCDYRGVSVMKTVKLLETLGRRTTKLA